MDRPLKDVSKNELWLELELRGGPAFQCFAPDCRHFTRSHFAACPKCGRVGYLCGSFKRDETTRQWKAWERLVFETYRPEHQTETTGE